jgi:hypothetical protein
MNVAESNAYRVSAITNNCTIEFNDIEKRKRFSVLKRTKTSPKQTLLPELPLWLAIIHWAVHVSRLQTALTASRPATIHLEITERKRNTLCPYQTTLLYIKP